MIYYGITVPNYFNDIIYCNIFGRSYKSIWLFSEILLNKKDVNVKLFYVFMYSF